ncbi:hypothetical protein XU18_1828 [Perkinsela sp. CCAP 1560/4]|nr:hypothetical protein XU18_1828 [Perkinsela sp. CCAP 1560/4]|eukprot:KNH07296.1 hypothetical protein XU18_1828 [Perkinsela sp. CCAP 1560/4]
MEVLFSTNPQGFYSAMTNIVAHEKDLDDSFAAKVTADVSKVTKKQFVLRDVDGLNKHLGCKSGVEVYNNYIFADPRTLESGEVLPGKFRQWLLIGASHQGYGGRRIYDTIHVNFALGASFLSGLFVNTMWYKVNFKYAKHLRVPASFVAFIAGIPFYKVLWGALGFNVMWINHHMRKALEALDCEKCLLEVKEKTLEDIRQLAHKTSDTTNLIERNMDTDVILVKRLIKSHRFDGHTCAFHSSS